MHGPVSLLLLNIRRLRNKLCLWQPKKYNFCFTEKHWNSQVKILYLQCECSDRFLDENLRHTQVELLFMFQAVCIPVCSTSSHHRWSQFGLRLLIIKTTQFLMCTVYTVYTVSNSRVSFWGDRNLDIEKASNINANEFLLGYLNENLLYDNREYLKKFYCWINYAMLQTSLLESRLSLEQCKMLLSYLI